MLNNSINNGYSDFMVPIAYVVMLIFFMTLIFNDGFRLRLAARVILSLLALQQIPQAGQIRRVVGSNTLFIRRAPLADSTPMGFTMEQRRWLAEIVMLLVSVVIVVWCLKRATLSMAS